MPGSQPDSSGGDGTVLPHGLQEEADRPGPPGGGCREGDCLVSTGRLFPALLNPTLAAVFSGTAVARLGLHNRNSGGTGGHRALCPPGCAAPLRLSFLHLPVIRGRACPAHRAPRSPAHLLPENGLRDTKERTQTGEPARMRAVGVTEARATCLHAVSSSPGQGARPGKPLVSSHTAPVPTVSGSLNLKEALAPCPQNHAQTPGADL